MDGRILERDRTGLPRGEVQCLVEPSRRASSCADPTPGNTAVALRVMGGEGAAITEPLAGGGMAIFDMSMGVEPGGTACVVNPTGRTPSISRGQSCQAG